MNKKRVLIFFGALLLVVGVFLVAGSKFGLTGAVIGTSSESVGAMFSAVGFVLIAISIIVVITGMFASIDDAINTNDPIINYVALKERIKSLSQHQSDRILILDTSLILSYSPADLEDLSKNYSLIVTPEVVTQVRDPAMKLVVQKTCTVQTPDPAYVSIASTALENASKNKFYDILTGRSPPPSNYTEGQKYRRICISLMDRIKSRHETPSPEKLKKEAERHFPVDLADVSVLAMAMQISQKTQLVLIGEKDVDLEESVNLVKKGSSKFSNIDYFSPYKEGFN